MRPSKTLGVLVLIAITLGACSSEKNAREQVSLSGVVHDSKGRPISDCSVSPSNRPEENAIPTDSSGRFDTAV